jgi:hypothetical protein
MNSARPSTATRKTRGRAGKRTPEEVLQTASLVLSYVKANEGSRLEQIGKGLGLPTKELTLPVTKLIESKSLKTKGQKRGTKYFAR